MSARISGMMAISFKSARPPKRINVRMNARIACINMCINVL